MVKTYFSDPQFYSLVIGIVFFLASLFFHVKEKEKLCILFLVLTALSINLFAALLDPFINIWDERFHALVSKNLLEHPFKLTLYDDPIVNIAYDRWDRYHIWLHKQPLFLWQIALSFKIFGVSELSLRLPNVFMGTILSFIIYDSGKKLVGKDVGYLASILFLSSYFLMNLVAGRQAVDHNDYSFLFYISLSIWGLINYNLTKNRKWIYLIGIFSGFAILCKWLVGLLVYFGWFLLELPQNKWKIIEYKKLLTSFLVASLIALPWQLFTFIKYPSEAKEAYLFNMHHFTQPLDGHSGTLWFHLENFDFIYGFLASFLLIPGIMAFGRKIKNKKMFLPILGMILIVFIFFSLASTKMLAFTTVVSMLIFISIASFFDLFFKWLYSINMSRHIKRFVVFIFILTIMGIRFDVEHIQAQHTLWKKENHYTRQLAHNKAVFMELDLPENTILFNVKGRQYIEAMFYTGITAYNIIPTEEQFEVILSKGKIPAVFCSNKDELPEYIRAENSTIFIMKELFGY